jgi:hypothetical protein
MPKVPKEMSEREEHALSNVNYAEVASFRRTAQDAEAQLIDPFIEVGVLLSG